MNIVGSPASRRQFLSTAGCLLAAGNASFSLATQDEPSKQSIQPAADPRQLVVKLFGAGVGSLDSYGTGIIVSPQGHVLTIANHLVSTGFLTAVTADGRRWPVETVATSTEHDAAIVRIQARPEDVFPFLDLQQAVDAEPGTPVLAWSNMFRVAAGNEPVSVVHGVIAASVPLEASQGRWKFPVKTPVWILDAITNNSGAGGGLVVDESGRAVGMIGREIRHARSRIWVNYAVPLTALRPVVAAMIEGRRITPSATAADSAPLISDRELTGRFGLTMLPSVIERTPAWVDAVTPDSPAARAGIRRGDLILLIGDAVITSVTDVRRQITAAVPGRELSVTVNRQNELTALKLAVPPARK
ncbi:MAG: S1C family serine protease [Planctomycetaceae bacterium]